MPTRRLRHGRAPVSIAALAIGLILPAAASAAYAPKLSVSISPPAPKAAAKITTVVTQASGETPNKTVVVSIPAGFGTPVAALAALPACPQQNPSASTCPAGARIGSASATASVLGLPVPLTGSVQWGGSIGNAKFLIYAFLDNDALNQHLTIPATLGLNPAGGFDTTFDNLPNTLTTSFTLTFDGGDKAVVLDPSTCGDFPWQATFTSQNGEKASSTAPVTISGCPPAAPALTALKATSTKVSFHLDQAAKVRVLVKGPGSRTQLDRTTQQAAGTRSVKLPHRLKKGHYRVSVTATGDGGSTKTRKTSLTIKR